MTAAAAFSVRRPTYKNISGDKASLLLLFRRCETIYSLKMGHQLYGQFKRQLKTFPFVIT